MGADINVGLLEDSVTDSSEVETHLRETHLLVEHVENIFVWIVNRTRYIRLAT